MGNFWPKSKAIGLQFCLKLSTKISGQKMGNFWPKSKAIGLQFCQNEAANWINFCMKISDKNWAIFGQKVRL